MGPDWSSGLENQPPGIPRLFQASGTGPAAQNLPKRLTNDLFGVWRWGHFLFLCKHLATNRQAVPPMILTLTVQSQSIEEGVLALAWEHLFGLLS